VEGGERVGGDERVFADFHDCVRRYCRVSSRALEVRFR
jgi:hypothetical protein